MTQSFDGTVAWLLQPDPANPGVRYFALRDLLDQTADAPEVVAAQAAVTYLLTRRAHVVDVLYSASRDVSDGILNLEVNPGHIAALSPPTSVARDRSRTGVVSFEQHRNR